MSFFYTTRSNACTIWNIQGAQQQNMDDNERWRANLKRNDPELYQYVLDSLAGASGGLDTYSETQQMREMVCCLRRDRRREQERQQRPAFSRYPQYPRPQRQFQQQPHNQQHDQHQPPFWGVQQTLPLQYMAFPGYPQYPQPRQSQQSITPWGGPRHPETPQWIAPQGVPQHPQSQHPAHYTTSWRAPQHHQREQGMARSEVPQRFQPQQSRDSKSHPKPQYPQPLPTPPDECIASPSDPIRAQPQQTHQLPPEAWPIPGLAPFPPAPQPRMQPPASKPVSGSSASTPDSVSVATTSKTTPPESPQRPFDWWEGDGPELWGHCRSVTDLLRRYRRDPDSVLSDDRISMSMRRSLLRMTSVPELRFEQRPDMKLAFPWNVYSNGSR